MDKCDKCGSVTSYNGWANYETWAYKLWMDNEPGPYEYWREVTREALDDPPNPHGFSWTDKDLARNSIMDQLQNDAEDNAPGVPCGRYSDLLQAAISTIDWYEIAEALLCDEIENREYQAAHA